MTLILSRRSNRLAFYISLVLCWSRDMPNAYLELYQTSIMNGSSRTARKMTKYGCFSGPYFPAFGLNTERYGVFSPNARIQFIMDVWQGSKYASVCKRWLWRLFYCADCITNLLLVSGKPQLIFYIS